MPRSNRASLKRPFGLSRKKPTVVGTGLIALDVVFGEGKQRTTRAWAGGTCANVLAILSYLGWHAYPVARLNGDSAARRVERDLRRWGVRLEWAKLQPGGRTPIVVQRIMSDDSGNGLHRFSLHCPHCGGWLPTYQAVPARVVRSLTLEVPDSSVVFLDRPSRGSIILAEHYKQKGALIFFEPSGKGDVGLFRRAYQLADIIKYSREQATGLALHRPRSLQAPVEVETLGSAGLRYRTALLGRTQRAWTEVPAYKVHQVSDPAGAGDWCSAGILHFLGRRGYAGLEKITSVGLLRAFRFGQALAAWNCGFEGARGGMYEVSLSQFRESVGHILKGARPVAHTNDGKKEPRTRLSVTICLTCGT